jgi:hypothetical protein
MFSTVTTRLRQPRYVAVDAATLVQRVRLQQPSYVLYSSIINASDVNMISTFIDQLI